MHIESMQINKKNSPATEAYTTQREGGTMQMNAQVGIYQTVNNINDYDTLHARPSTQPQQCITFVFIVFVFFVVGC